MTNIVKEFLVKCQAIDTESTGLDPTTADICELGLFRYENNKPVKISKLFGTTEPIPFAASAKNNISRKMLENLPTFTSDLRKVDVLLELDNYKFLVAHNYKYDKTILQSHINRISPDLIFAKNNTWICTYRLAKQLYTPTDDDTLSYSLSYLRYFKDLDIEEEIATHRAGDDAYVCFKLFEQIVNDIYRLFGDDIKDSNDLANVVKNLSSAPIIYETLPFGKHKGKLIKDIAVQDPKYLFWCLDNMDTFNPRDINYDHDLFLSITNVLEEVL